MKIKAIVYDNVEPVEIVPQSILLEKGQPKYVISENGKRHKDFHIWDDSKPCKYNNFKVQ